MIVMWALLAVFSDIHAQWQQIGPANEYGKVILGPEGNYYALSRAGVIKISPQFETIENFWIANHVPLGFDWWNGCSIPGFNTEGKLYVGFRGSKISLVGSGSTTLLSINSGYHGTYIHHISDGTIMLYADYRYRSTDGGVSWQQLPGNLNPKWLVTKGDSVYGLTNYGGFPLVMNWGQYLYYSFNGGIDFSFIDLQTYSINVGSIVNIWISKNILHVCLYDGRIYILNENDSTLQQKEVLDFDGIEYVTEVEGVKFLKTHSAFYRSDEGQVGFEDISHTIPYRKFMINEISKINGRFFLSTTNGLFVEVDASSVPNSYINKKAVHVTFDGSTEDITGNTYEALHNLSYFFDRNLNPEAALLLGYWSDIMRISSPREIFQNGHSISFLFNMINTQKSYENTFTLFSTWGQITYDFTARIFQFLIKDKIYKFQVGEIEHQLFFKGWNHILISLVHSSPSVPMIMLNGVELQRIDNSLPVDLTNFQIGDYVFANFGFWSTFGFPGSVERPSMGILLDELILFNDGLSASEGISLFNSYNLNFVNSSFEGFLMTDSLDHVFDLNSNETFKLSLMGHYRLLPVGETFSLDRPNATPDRTYDFLKEYSSQGDWSKFVPVSGGALLPGNPLCESFEDRLYIQGLCGSDVAVVDKGKTLYEIGPFTGRQIRLRFNKISDADANQSMFAFKLSRVGVSSDGGSQIAWKIPIHVANGAFSATATLGADPNASDGFDELLDTPEAPAPSGEFVRAYFSHPEWNGLLTNKYSADIRAASDLSALSKTWTLTVETNRSGPGTLLFTRPAGLPWPIVVTLGAQKWVSRSGNLAIPFTSDGTTLLHFNIQVGDTTPPAIVGGSQLSGPAIWDNAIPRTLGWTVTDGGQVDSVYVEYSLTGGQSWESIYTGTGTSFTWNPATAGVNQDVLFRITAIDKAGNLGFWQSINAVTVVSRKQSVSFSAGWTLASAPYAVVNTSESVIGGGFRYRWDGSRYDQTNVATSGSGYWVGAYRTVTDTLSGTLAEHSQSRRYPRGWRIIGNPLLRPVSVDSMLVTDLNTGASLPFRAAVDSGWVSPPTGYEVEGYSASDMLAPFKGYWMGVTRDSVALTFPLHRLGQVVSKDNLPAFVQVSVVDGAFGHTLKVGPAALSNLPAPPAAPNAAQIGLKGERTVLGDLYLSRIIPQDAQHYTQIFTSGPQRTITLSWPNQSIPGMEFQLLMGDGRVFDLTKSGTVVWNATDPEPMIKSGPVSTSNESSRNFPQTLALHQNYPNPFNPSTQITFDLPSSGSVTLKVYNMVGQEIATLVNGNRPAGSHSVPFEASHLSSGVYIYRLQVGSTVLTKKMVLLK
jgi:hypothetical protein